MTNWENKGKFSYIQVKKPTSFGQRWCHLMARVVSGPPWPEKKIYIYIHNNLKFYIYLPLKKILGTPWIFFMPIKLNFGS